MRASRLGDVGGKGRADVAAELGDGSTCRVGFVILPVHINQILELRKPLRSGPHVGDRPLDAADISLLHSDLPDDLARGLRDADHCSTILPRVLLQEWLVICYNEPDSLNPRSAETGHGRFFPVQMASL